MSLHVLGAPLAGLVGAVPAADGGGYQAPTTQEFYQPLIGDGPFAITRAAVVILLSVALIGYVLVRTTRRAAIVPSRGQWMTESVYGLVRNGVARDIIGSHDFMRFVPMLFSMFVLILVNNLFGVIPPVQFPTMSRIGFPIALTLIVYVVYHYLGIKKNGFVGYFKGLVPEGVSGPGAIPLFILELVSNVMRLLSLSVRLFANILAGHLIILFMSGGLAVLLGLEALGVFTLPAGVALFLFELGLVATLQAFIFATLSAIYIGGAVAEHH